MDSIKEQLKEASDGKVEICQIEEMLHRVTYSQMFSLLYDIESTSEWIGYEQKPLNDQQKVVLRAVINHAVEFAKYTKEWDAVERVFPYVGWMDEETVLYILDAAKGTDISDILWVSQSLCINPEG